MEFQLQPFTDSDVERIEGEIQIRDEELIVRFQLHGADDRLVWPKPEIFPQRRDELWKSTCFEVFLKVQGSRYFEVNLSPAGHWQVYQFEDYRKRVMQEFPVKQVELKGKRCQSLIARINWSLPSTVEKIGVTCVLETGQIEYWALTHPNSEPDFHDPRSFVLEV